MKNRANLHATLRGVATLYLISIAVRLVKGTQESASIPIQVAWLIAAVFTLAGVFFGIYAWRSYRRELETADEPHHADLKDQSPKAPV